MVRRRNRLGVKKCSLGGINGGMVRRIIAEPEEKGGGPNEPYHSVDSEHAAPAPKLDEMRSQRRRDSPAGKCRGHEQSLATTPFARRKPAGDDARRIGISPRFS